MLPYTVIKEANPPQFGGTATGVVNFLNFTFSALFGPLFGWILQYVSRAEPLQWTQDIIKSPSRRCCSVSLVAIILCLFSEGNRARSQSVVLTSGIGAKREPNLPELENTNKCW